MVSCLALIILAIPRGFDFTDEGLYMLLADPRQQNIAGVFNYDLFFKLIHHLSGIEFGVNGMRFLRLLTIFIGAFFLMRFFQPGRQTRQDQLKIYVLAFFGLASSYGFLSQSLSYNHLSVMLACIWLYAFTAKKWRISTFVLLGLSLAGLFYVKITTCLLLCLLTVARLGYFLFSDGGLWKRATFIFLPFILFELAFLTFLGESGLLRIQEAVAYQTDRPGYLWSNVIKYALVGLLWLMITIVPFFLAGYLYQLKKWRFIFFVLGLLALGFTMKMTTVTAEYAHLPVLILMAMIGYTLGKCLKSPISSRMVFLLTVLFVLPFAIYFGSNIYFFRMTSHFAVFWVFGYFLLSQELQTRLEFRQISVVGSVAFLIILIGLWVFPSHYAPLYSQQTLWPKGGRALLLSEDQHNALKALEGKLASIHQSEPLFVFANPGVPYLLGLTIPKSPLIWNGNDLESRFSDEEVHILVYNGFEKLPEPYSSFAVMDSVKAGNYQFVILQR